MKNLLWRLLTTVLLLGAIFIASRGIVRALPGDPLDTLIAESGTSIPAAELRKELNLDKPFIAALAQDLVRWTRGDFGISLFSKKPVAPLLADRFVKTLQLTLLSFLLAAAIAVPLGVLAAAYPGGRLDLACTLFGGASAAFPMSWLGPILLILFSVWIPIFPTGGAIGLPALALSLSVSGFWARLVRERAAETLARGAAPAARARGLPEWRVLIKYGLAPASGSLLGYFGTQFGGLLAGAFVTESVFDWKGMGSLLVEAVLRRDYPVIEAAIFVAAASSLGGTLLGDWLQNRLDPRLEDAHANRP